MSVAEVPDPSERQQYTVTERANEEANKLFYDVFKHLTTLSTGSILILASLLETLFPNPHWRFLIVIALVSFIVSTVSAVRMMFFQASAVMERRRETTRGEHVGFMITVASFLLGIGSFVVFAIMNFYG
jgi:hypothetical protein